MDSHERAQLIEQAICHVIDSNGDALADTMAEIGSNSDSHQMYGVCCALGELAKKVLHKLYPDIPADGQFVLEMIDPGQPEEPPKLFALRFIVAYANGDTDTCLALYHAAQQADTDSYVDSIICLVVDVGSLTKLALDQLKDGQS